MRRAIVALLGSLAVAAILGCRAQPAAPTPDGARRTPAAPAVDQRCVGVTIWGCSAHREVATSSSCDDLQSWFDAADAQRGAYLRSRGRGDPNYRYAFDVMMQADERMRSIGCYG